MSANHLPFFVDALLHFQYIAAREYTTSQRRRLPTREPHLVELDALVAARHHDAALLGRSALQSLLAAVRVRRPAWICNGVKRTMFALPRYGSDLSAIRPAEHGDPIRVIRLGVPKRRRDLPPRLAPDQRCDLCRYRDGSQGGTRRRVEEMNALVVGTATRRDQPLAPRAEGDGLDRRPVTPTVLLRARR